MDDLMFPRLLRGTCVVCCSRSPSSPSSSVFIGTLPTHCKGAYRYFLYWSVRMKCDRTNKEAGPGILTVFNTERLVLSIIQHVR